jgi:hypothetical protein
MAATSIRSLDFLSGVPILDFIAAKVNTPHVTKQRKEEKNTSTQPQKPHSL